MHNLTRIIGPAPSELSLEELERKLVKERERVTDALEAYKQSFTLATKKSTPKKLKVDDKIRKMAEQLGMTVEEYIELASEAIKEKRGIQLSLNLKEADNGEEDNDRDSSFD